MTSGAGMVKLSRDRPFFLNRGRPTRAGARAGGGGHPVLGGLRGVLEAGDQDAAGHGVHPGLGVSLVGPCFGRVGAGGDRGGGLAVAADQRGQVGRGVRLVAGHAEGGVGGALGLHARGQLGAGQPGLGQLGATGGTGGQGGPVVGDEHVVGHARGAGVLGQQGGLGGVGVQAVLERAQPRGQVGTRGSRHRSHLLLRQHRPSVQGHGHPPPGHVTASLTQPGRRPTPCASPRARAR